jgi:hypothetical protein
MAALLLMACGVVALFQVQPGLPWLLGGALIAVGLFEWLRPPSIPPELQTLLREADRIRKNDPGAAGQHLDRYFEREASRREEERATLSQQAQYDADAARRLERILRQDLDGHRSMRRRVIPTLPEEQRLAAIAQVDEMERQTNSELAKLQASLRRIRG